MRGFTPMVDLRDRLRAIMKERSLSTNRWASMAGINEGTLRHFLNDPDRRMTIDTLEALGQAIGLSAIELLDDAAAYAELKRQVETDLPLLRRLAQSKTLPADERARIAHLVAQWDEILK